MSSVEESKVQLEKRIEQLEKNVANLVEILDKMKQSITLKSPNGLHTISLMATDLVSGLWIERGEGQPMVTVYNSEPSAVIGIYGKADKDGWRRGALDIALHHDPKTGGNIQMMDAENKLYTLTPDETGEGVQIKQRLKF